MVMNWQGAEELGRDRSFLGYFCRIETLNVGELNLLLSL